MIPIDGRQECEPREGNSYEFTLGEETALELELSAEDLLALSGPRAVQRPTTAPASATDLRPKSPAPSRAAAASRGSATTARVLHRRTAGMAWIAGVAVAAVLIGLIVYVSSGAGHPTDGAMANASPRVAATAALSMAVSERLPVRFTNPFDKTEVFEFPPGTSEAEARERVADLLIARAKERRHRHERVAALRRVRATFR